jgi:hypothetical protein
MNGPEIREIFAIYTGLPSPACSGSVGKRVMNTNLYLDRYGRALHSEKARPGDAYRIRHSAVVPQIVAFTRRYGYPVEYEITGEFKALTVQPERLRGLLLGVPPPTARPRW